MLIYDSVWNAIRTEFTSEEKKELRKAVQGQSICPRGVFVDEHDNGLPDALRTKFFNAYRTQERKMGLR